MSKKDTYSHMKAPCCLASSIFAVRVVYSCSYLCHDIYHAIVFDVDLLLNVDAGLT